MPKTAKPNKKRVFTKKEIEKQRLASLPYPCRYKADGTTVIDMTNSDDEHPEKTKADAFGAIKREVAKLKE